MVGSQDVVHYKNNRNYTDVISFHEDRFTQGIQHTSLLGPNHVYIITASERNIPLWILK